MSNERDDPEPRRMIYEIRRRVQAARNRYWADGVDSDLSSDTHRELAIAALQYHDVLYEFRDESVLGDDDWPDVEPLRERVNKTVRRREQSEVFGEPATTKEVPAVQMIPAEQLVELTESLDDLAKKLGFGANASTDVERDDFSEEDLAALVETRGQTDAIDDTPDDIRERVADEVGTDGD